MMRDVPFTLGPFTVGDGGALALRAPDGQAGLHLVWRGRAVQAKLDPAGTLAVRMLLGRVPSSAGARAAGRGRAFAAVTALRRALPAGWGVALLADHRIAAETRHALALPTTAGALLSALTCALLDLGPYLAVLDTGAPALELPGTAAGRVKIWPG